VDLDADPRFAQFPRLEIDLELPESNLHALEDYHSLLVGAKRSACHLSGYYPAP
jgi:hypothetical protein